MTTPKGYTELTNASPMSGPEQIAAAERFVEDLIDPTVPTTVDLPASGNWIGRRIRVTDGVNSTNGAYVWLASGWWREGGSTLTSDSTSLLTLAAGWTLNNTQAAWCGGVVSWRISVTKTTPAVPAATSGNIANTKIATIAATELRPLHTTALSTDNTGSLSGCYVDPDGTINIGAVIANTGVAIGDTYAVSGVWIRAF